MLRLLMICTALLLLFGRVEAGQETEIPSPAVASAPVSPTPPLPNQPAPPGHWVYQRDLTPFEEQLGVWLLYLIFGIPVSLICGEQAALWFMRRYRQVAWNARMEKSIESYRKSIAALQAKKVPV